MRDSNDEASDTKPAMVLLHGWGATAAGEFLPDLRRACRGTQGHSTWPPGAPTMKTSLSRSHHMTNPAKPGPSREPSRPSAPPPPPSWRNWLLLAAVIVTLLLLFTPRTKSTTTVSYNYTQFLSQVHKNHVKTASINPTGAVTGELTNKSDYTVQIPTALNNSQLTGILEAHHVTIIGVASTTSVWSVILTFLPLVLLVGIFVWLGRRSGRALGGIMGFGGSKAKVYQEDRPSTRFSDVAGYEGAKREVAEVVGFLKDPGKYSRAGAVGPRGVLMVGPPGSGKTLMARAVVGEAEVPFLALTGSSFVEMFVGVGAVRGCATSSPTPANWRRRSSSSTR